MPLTCTATPCRPSSCSTFEDTLGRTGRPGRCRAGTSTRGRRPRRPASPKSSLRSMRPRCEASIARAQRLPPVMVSTPSRSQMSFRAHDLAEVDDLAQAAEHVERLVLGAVDLEAGVRTFAYHVVFECTAAGRADRRRWPRGTSRSSSRCSEARSRRGGPCASSAWGRRLMPLIRRTMLTVPPRR